MFVGDYSEDDYLGAFQEIESDLAGLQLLMPCLESKLEPMISIQEKNLAGIEERLIKHAKTTLKQFHEQQIMMKNLQGTINTVESHQKSISETIEKMDSTLTDVNNSQTFDLSELKKILSYNLSEHDRIQDIGHEMKTMETLFFEIQKNVVLKQLLHLSNEQHESINNVGEDLPKMKLFLSGIFEKLMSTYHPYDIPMVRQTSSAGCLIESAPPRKKPNNFNTFTPSKNPKSRIWIVKKRR